MEFTKKDASAFARLRKGKRAEVCETRRLLEKRSRQLMEQSALLKHDIDTFKDELATIGIHDYLTGVAHVCACSPLCPAVWSMLPVTLLQRVFACLPLPDIIRLRVLSKTWDRYVTGVTPGFTKLCAERNPNMFALVSEGSEDDHYNTPDNGPLVIKPYDSKEGKWHHFVDETCVRETYSKMWAGNGGLLCLVYTAPDKEMEIVVFNPLTRQARELPPSSSLSRIQPRMVQLVMDRDSKCYKVLVVSQNEHGGDMIFSSLTGKWSKPNIFSDLIFDSHFMGHDNLGHGEKPDPCAYDCASSTMLDLDDGSYPCRLGDKCILVKDHLFVLHEKHMRRMNQFFLKDYQVRSCQPHWVQVKVHTCYQLGAESIGYRGAVVELMTQLWGCPGFLVVNACGGCQEDYAHKLTLLFDLSTSKWQTISEIPEFWPTSPAAQMFELQWDAVA